MTREEYVVVSRATVYSAYCIDVNMFIVLNFKKHYSL